MSATSLACPALCHRVVTPTPICAGHRRRRDDNKECWERRGPGPVRWDGSGGDVARRRNAGPPRRHRPVRHHRPARDRAPQRFPGGFATTAPRGEPFPHTLSMAPPRGTTGWKCPSRVAAWEGGRHAATPVCGRAGVKGGAKLRRVADPNRGARFLCTPGPWGRQFLSRSSCASCVGGDRLRLAFLARSLRGRQSSAACVPLALLARGTAFYAFRPFSRRRESRRR